MDRSDGANLIWSTMMALMVAMAIAVDDHDIDSKAKEDESQPKPKAWPEQFHALLVMNKVNKDNTEVQVNNLWYDWPNGRNLNLIQHQLDKLVYDVEWNNGTSYYYSFQPRECRTLHFEVGILRPNWLDGATYLGQRNMDGFLCNVWEKVDFIFYYEDVITKRPVYWQFYTGLAAHVITFEVGAVLEDAHWQAPAYCFDNQHKQQQQPPPSLSRPPVAFV